MGDAVVFVRLNEATTNVQLELANLQAAGLTVDLEADSALGKQTLEQALHAVAHHVAYIGTLATYADMCNRWTLNFDPLLATCRRARRLPSNNASSQSATAICSLQRSQSRSARL